MTYWGHRLQITRVNGGKLDFYAQLKTNFGLEHYLNLPFNLRQPITKFRVSNHRLRIETGRHEKPFVDRQLRTCKYCTTNEIDNEVHFFFRCPFYRYERNDLFKVIDENFDYDLQNVSNEPEQSIALRQLYPMIPTY